MKTQKRKKSTVRNWHAVDAHFRNSAGPMSNKKKKKDKCICEELVNLPPVWEDFPGTILSESFSNDENDLLEFKKVRTMEDEMWEYYKRMRPDEYNEDE